MNKYVEKFAYIINIDNSTTRKEYPNAKLYKIGEGTKKRPYALIDKYDSKNAHIIKDQIQLNINNDVRITDGNIRNYILRNFSGIFKEEPRKVAYNLNIIFVGNCIDKHADGLTECLVIPDSYDVVQLVEEACNYFRSHKSEASGKVQQNYIIPYDVKHLVNLNLSRRIYKFLLNDSGTGIDLYKTANQSILFIGQFDNVFLNRIADENDVTLFIDDTKQYESTLTLEDFNVKIIYSMEELVELMAEKDFDIVISNPPYGKIGAEITHNIINNIDYKVFINLMPANDYHRGNDDLYKYADVTSMTPVINGFSDAKVTTHMTLIRKSPDLYITKEKFEIENYIDESLKKYFYENVNRKHYAIDAIISNLNDNTKIMPNSNVTVLIGWRDLPNHHMPYSKNCTTYKWNMEKSIDAEYLYNNVGKNSAKVLSLSTFTFNSAIEKDNFVNFMYSSNGFRFIAKLFTAVNVDVINNSAITKILPKVDWSHEWTVEEILADYGYNENEIKEVMNDLVNFKDMDR